MAVINIGCEQGCRSYPCTLPRTTLSRGALRLLHRALVGSKSPYGELDLFDDDGSHAITAWDLPSPTDGPWINGKWKGIGPVREAMREDSEEPRCRFIFILMRNSREPLNCTLEQLAYILTHYQVMAPFLEHIFTFKRRSEAHLHAAFRSEDYLWDQGSTFSTTSDIVDGDLRIQHCFNLVGLEYEFDQFNFRQAAVYYKLDMSSGKAVWILIKGNKVIREIIEESTQNRVTLDQLSTPLEVFLLGLKIHLLIYEWATQNWMPYIDSLQQKYDESSKAVRNTPIGEKTDDKKLDKIIASKSWNFGLHQRKSWSEKLTSGLSLSKRRTGQVTSGAKSADPIQSPHLDISQIFSIDKLQSLHRQTTDVQEAILVLDQNKAVLHDMVNRFHYLRESEELRQQMGIEESDPFQGFFRTCQQYIRDLESQRGRLGAIMADLERVTSSFDGILQFSNMRLGETYARIAKASADKMEGLTAKAKHEAVSIHAITMLTLLFLPGTFVAVRNGLSFVYTTLAWILTGFQTFFSSGIIDFEYGEEQDRLGDWKIRWGALRLFGVVVGPLTGLVLTAWAITYFVSSRSRRRRDSDAARGNAV